MGHRTYLLIQSGGQVEQLFEANNMLPVFWLGLLEQADLQAVAPQWYLLDQMEQEGPEEELERFVDQWPSPTNVVLSQSVVVANSARFARVLQQHRPELVGLHQEFMRYLQARLSQETDQVQLDMVALTAFTSTTECLQSLHDELAAFNQGQLPVLDIVRNKVLLTGFANGPVSSAEYPELSYLMSSVNQQSRAAEPAEPATSKRNIFFLLSAVVAGALLLIASYRGFQKDGLTAMVLLVLLLGVAVLAGGVAGLLAHRPRKL